MLKVEARLVASLHVNTSHEQCWQHWLRGSILRQFPIYFSKVVDRKRDQQNEISKMRERDIFILFSSGDGWQRHTMEGGLRYKKWFLWYKFKREFYVEIILSNCDLADKFLSRNYNMETYIQNDVIKLLILGCFDPCKSGGGGEIFVPAVYISWSTYGFCMKPGQCLHLSILFTTRSRGLRKTHNY